MKQRKWSSYEWGVLNRFKNNNLLILLTFIIYLGILLQLEKSIIFIWSQFVILDSYFMSNLLNGLNIHLQLLSCVLDQLDIFENLKR